MKTYPNELCQLIIRNIDIIEQAPKVMEVIEKKLFHEIDEIVKNFFHNKNEWNEKSNFYEDGTYFAPQQWHVKDEDYYAYYDLDYMGESNYGLSNLIAINGFHFAINFNVDYSLFSSLNKTKTKSLLTALYNENPALQEIGFQLSADNTVLSLPIIFEKELLASEYPTIDESLQPLRDALGKIISVHHILDDFVQKVRSEYK